MPIYHLLTMLLTMTASRTVARCQCRRLWIYSDRAILFRLPESIRHLLAATFEDRVYSRTYRCLTDLKTQQVLLYWPLF